MRLDKIDARPCTHSWWTAQAPPPAPDRPTSLLANTTLKVPSALLCRFLSANQRHIYPSLQSGDIHGCWRHRETHTLSAAFIFRRATMSHHPSQGHLAAQNNTTQRGHGPAWQHLAFLASTNIQLSGGRLPARNRRDWCVRSCHRVGAAAVSSLESSPARSPLFVQDTRPLPTWVQVAK